MELLCEGLTFDLRGLADGPSRPVPDIAHRFDFSAAAAMAELEALSITPGPHLAGGERSMPVLKGILGLARDLTQHFEDLQAVYWQPSRSAIGWRFFESVITAWLEGRAFPALGLTAFDEVADGALQSVGLAFWIGQELRIEPPLTADKVAATRLGVQLVNQLVIVGGLDESERIIAPDGTRLVMRPHHATGSSSGCGANRCRRGVAPPSALSRLPLGQPQRPPRLRSRVPAPSPAPTPTALGALLRADVRRPWPRAGRV